MIEESCLPLSVHPHASRVHNILNSMYIICEHLNNQFRDSIVASIPACHAGDRGSIPRRGAFFGVRTNLFAVDVVEHLYAVVHFY